MEKNKNLDNKQVNKEAKKASTKKKRVLKKKPLIITICVLLCLVLGASIFLIVSNSGTSLSEDKYDPAAELAEIEALISEEDRKYIEDYDTNKEISSSFVGTVKFESGLIDLPFVQGPDNDYFLREDWKTSLYSTLGSIFMDYECTLDSENIILYGHNAFSYYDAGTDDEGNKLVNDELMFTPLKFLVDEDNYEENKTVYLILENEVREYEIVSVYYCPLEGEGDNVYPEEGLAYYSPEYDDEYFENYKKKIKEIEFYDTDVDFTNEDKFLTLQTCIEGNDMAREIVLCKQVSTRKLDREAYKEYLIKIDEYNAKLEENANAESNEDSTTSNNN